MVMGELAEKAQVVVIGAGPGGYVAAIRAAQLGKDVILIDKEEKLGGICLHHGCIPSKALIHASNFAHAIKRAGVMGIKTGKVTVETKKLQQWKKGIISTLADGIAGLCKLHHIEVLAGEAQFVGPNQVHVGGELLTYENAIIATGVTRRELPVLPYDGKFIMSAKEVLALDTVPKEFVIVGGGYIGLELGTVFAKLGSHITILEAQEQILPGYEPEVVAVVQKRLVELGAAIFTSAQVTGRKGTKIQFEYGGKRKEVIASAVLVAVGSTPNTSGLGLEHTKVQLDENGYLKVDAQMQTDEKAIFAIGDCVGAPMLAHRASRQGKVAAEVIAGLPSAFDNVACPAVLFTDPEIATVGLSEAAARLQGYEPRVGKFPFKASSRALTMNETDGFVKVVADSKTEQILGVTIVGVNASELISEACLAIEMGAFLEDLVSTIHQHPTLSESLMEAAEAVKGTAIHVFQMKS
ncbi:dihydrolipoyl dehydrogenase [Candidatus Woesearchaeota archaeon]|nr:dihydrolipoyl dehydrogenase [Candidatus Woesearchaeota archaeon]